MKDSGMSCEESTFAAVSAAKEAAKPFDGKVALDVALSANFSNLSALCPLIPRSNISKVQMTAGEKAGADLIFIETMMDLYEAKSRSCRRKGEYVASRFCNDDF